MGKSCQSRSKFLQEHVHNCVMVCSLVSSTAIVPRSFKSSRAAPKLEPLEPPIITQTQYHSIHHFLITTQHPRTPTTLTSYSPYVYHPISPPPCSPQDPLPVLLPRKPQGLCELLVPARADSSLQAQVAAHRMPAQARPTLPLVLPVALQELVSCTVSGS